MLSNKLRSSPQKPVILASLLAFQLGKVPQIPKRKCSEDKTKPDPITVLPLTEPRRSVNRASCTVVYSWTRAARVGLVRTSHPNQLHCSLPIKPFKSATQTFEVQRTWKSRLLFRGVLISCTRNFATLKIDFFFKKKACTCSTPVPGLGVLCYSVSVKVFLVQCTLRCKAWRRRARKLWPMCPG